MTDPLFIEQKLQKGEQAREKAEHYFSGLSPVQLNWKPTMQNWSIAECLDHLVISDALYFNDLEKIAGGTYKMTWWQKNSPLSSLWGKSLKKQLQETVNRKMKAPKIIKPSASVKPHDILEIYLKNLDCFLKLITMCKNCELDKTIITSPISNVVTYSLRDAFEFLINHEHRHLNQALWVKNREEFPKT
ncbi:MAG TPA: DinB family protein [Flavobacteriales bacterium]|nr:DinB family protein [Flavobacteriales bacterium]